MDASKKVFLKCISQRMLALRSFQWVAPPKMYFSAAVSWTKASICSGSPDLDTNSKLTL